MTAIFSRMMATAVNPADYIPLPAAKDEPCHLCGRRPTSSVRRGGGGVYLCYDCLITAKRPAKVQSLPGVLDHRTFTRTKVELGRCDVYGMGKAVYRLQEADICEGCYAWLVREWNAMGECDELVALQSSTNQSIPSTPDIRHPGDRGCPGGWHIVAPEPFSPIGSNMNHVEQDVSIQIVALLLRSDSHPRKLAQDLGLSHTTVLRKLKGLLDGNIVDFRMEGKNKTYFLKKTLEARVHVYVAEWYALENLIQEAPHLRSIIKAVQEREDFPLAVIFGSYAKGTADKKSDIDLYIETEDRETKRELERCHSKLSVKIGLWDPENLLIQEIVKNHVIVKGVERFYEKTGFFE